MTKKDDAAEPVLYARIVVPLDMSDLAELALPHASTVAQSTGTTIQLIHVVDITPLTQLSMVGFEIEQAAVLAALEGIEAEAGAAEEYLESVRQHLAAKGVTATTAVVTGLVVSELLNAIAPNDLVAMTTHGRTGLERWLMGSVAEAVIRRSSAPVLLVRATSTADQSDASRAAA
jgi:nucleotide-binding universal stress UspA family protein